MPRTPARKVLRDRLPPGLAKRYRATLVELERHGDAGDAHQEFAARVVGHGEAARAWKAALEAGHADPAEAQRQADATYLRSAPKHAGALRAIAANMDQHPRKAAWEVGIALGRMNEESQSVQLLSASTTTDGVNPFAIGPGTASDWLARLLKHWASAKEETPLAKAGPFMHRVQAMALLYPQPIDRRPARADAVVNSLLFAAVGETRLFTGGGGCLSDDGGPMPEDGEPMWPLAAALANDALEFSLTAKVAEDRLSKLLKRNPGLGWVGWPELPEGEPRRLAPKKNPKRR
jgi:hypothetical protein